MADGREHQSLNSSAALRWNTPRSQSSSIPGSVGEHRHRVGVAVGDVREIAAEEYAVAQITQPRICTGQNGMVSSANAVNAIVVSR